MGRELLLVRHGESAWNLEGRIQGQSRDAPGLTLAGAAQARRAAGALAGSGARLVVASDLTRALETATPIVDRLDVPWRPEPLLRERALGVTEGNRATSTVDLGVEGGRVVDADARPDGGESIRELYARVAGFLDTLRGEGESPVVLVTHGGVVRVALAYLEGTSPDDMAWIDVPNASIWRAAC